MKMRATQNFFCGTAVADQMVSGGAVFDDTDPVVKAFPAFFEPVYETVSNPPEPAKEPEPAPKKATRRRSTDA